MLLVCHGRCCFGLVKGRFVTRLAVVGLPVDVRQVLSRYDRRGTSEQLGE